MPKFPAWEGNATSLAPRHVDERQSQRPRGLGLASTGICLFSLTDQSHLAMSFKLWMRWERARVQAEANMAVLGGISLATLRKSYSLSIIVQVKIKRILDVHV